jgi:hypothetical protein
MTLRVLDDREATQTTPSLLSCVSAEKAARRSEVKITKSGLKVINSNRPRSDLVSDRGPERVWPASETWPGRSSPDLLNSFKICQTSSDLHQTSVRPRSKERTTSLIFNADLRADLLQTCSEPWFNRQVWSPRTRPETRSDLDLFKDLTFTPDFVILTSDLRADLLHRDRGWKGGARSAGLLDHLTPW